MRYWAENLGPEELAASAGEGQLQMRWEHTGYLLLEAAEAHMGKQ